MDMFATDTKSMEFHTFKEDALKFTGLENRFSLTIFVFPFNLKIVSWFIALGHHNFPVHWS